MIQIPCLNEEETIPLVLQDIPKQIDGIDEIEYTVINPDPSNIGQIIALVVEFDPGVVGTSGGNRRIRQT